MTTRYFLGICAIALALIASCAEPDEAVRVDLPVVVDASGMTPLSTDLGYEVEVVSVRIALSGLVFTVAGEVHVSSYWQDLNALMPMAHAHPGHYQGGEVTGELLGSYIVDWPAEDGRVLGDATLLAGNYSAANFTFDRGSTGLNDVDPLVGHTAIIAGTATKNGKTVSFTFVVDSPEGRVLVGVPFEARIGQDTSGALHFQFNPQDPLEGDTLFDAIDFEALDTDGDGDLMIGPDDDAVAEPYNSFRRVFQTHDHYRVQHLE